MRNRKISKILKNYVKNDIGEYMVTRTAGCQGAEYKCIREKENCGRFVLPNKTGLAIIG
jgi:hypothetical protein